MPIKSELEMAAVGATPRGMKAGALEFNVGGTPEDPGGEGR